MVGGSGGDASDSVGASKLEHRALSLRFVGTTEEYFRVWIVNLCLTLLTFGIFSAWAKVRKKRYLYSHTLLDGTPFQYLGRPLPILKGRLIAALLFVAWYLTSRFYQSFYPFVLLAGAVLAPWMIVRSLAFNARYSAFRNLTFHFRGTYWGTFATLLGCVTIVLVTCGLGYPWAEARLRRYLIGRTSYGGVRGRLKAKGKHFLRVYLVVAAIMTGLVAASWFLFLAGDGRVLPPQQLLLVFTATTYAAYTLIYTYRQAGITNLVWSRTKLGPLSFRATLRFRDLVWLYASNLLAIVASLGLLVPWATLRVVRYRTEHFEVEQRGALDRFEGHELETVRATAAEVADIFDFDLSL